MGGVWKIDGFIYFALKIAGETVFVAAPKGREINLYFFKPILLIQGNSFEEIHDEIGHCSRLL